MHYQRLASINTELHKSLKDLRKDYSELKLNFEKYVIRNESKFNSLKLENAQLRDELVKKVQVNEEQSILIVELTRKLGLDSDNSSIPPSKSRKYKNSSSKDNNSAQDSKSPNLLAKLELFAHQQDKSIILTQRDNKVLEALLSLREFSPTGCYGMFHDTLSQLLNNQHMGLDVGKLANLLHNDKFMSLAGYKRRGGQSGHKGSNLEQFATVDEVKNIMPEKCSCGCSDITIGHDYEARQQINLRVERIVTEFRLRLGTCNNCGKRVKATSDIPSNVSYHNMVRCYAVYMLDAHFMTYERLALYFKEVFGLPISEGSINNWRREFAKKLGVGYIAKLRAELIKAPYLHADETGLNVAGSNLWAHVVCNKDATLLHISPKRGYDGITASDVLQSYAGTLIADGWAAYKSLPKINGIQACFAHLFRYFTDMTDNYKQTWSHKMSNLLKFVLDSTKRLFATGITNYSDEVKTYISGKYDKILDEGAMELSCTRYGKGHPTQCLLKRLRKEKDSVLYFLNDISIPLTNNEAERSLRPIKVQQKISGTSLSVENAQENLSIRSFTATCKKQKIGILSAMGRIFINPTDFELNINTS